MRPIVNDKLVKFSDRVLNRSREIPPEVTGGVIFCRFSKVDKFRLEIADDVISRVAVDSKGMKVRVKFSDYRSNRSRRYMTASLCDG